MRKRNLFTLMLVALLAFSLGMGTLAWYTKSFTSNDNIVRAASFEVDDNGTLAEDVMFDLDDDPIYPGRNMDVYEFEIAKNNTEVPVKYDITVTGLDPLFEGNSPVALTVLRKVGDNWEEFVGTELTSPGDLEEFKINLFWDHTDNDIDYQGKPGKININVVATQVAEEAPEEPEPPVDNRVINAEAGVWYVGLNKLDVRVRVNVENYDEAFFYKATGTVNGQTYTTTMTSFFDDNWVKLFDFDPRVLDDPLPDVLNIMFYGSAKQLLDTVENVPVSHVGD